MYPRDYIYPTTLAHLDHSFTHGSIPVQNCLDRNRMYTFLINFDIETGIHCPIPNHQDNIMERSSVNYPRTASPPKTGTSMKNTFNIIQDRVKSQHFKTINTQCNFVECNTRCEIQIQLVHH